jgi:hypothetical protein
VPAVIKALDTCLIFPSWHAAETMESTARSCR